jgi:CBS domain containing-hemolysin-like protein
VLVVFVPLAVLLYPMFKFLPQIYDRFLRMKIMRMYDEMKLIEAEMEVQGQGHDANEINAKLDQLDQRASRLRLPTAYASTLYTLRSHIVLIRNRVLSS